MVGETESETSSDSGISEFEIQQETVGKPRFNKSLDLHIFSLVRYFKKINAFLVYSICIHKIVHNKWCLD